MVVIALYFWCFKYFITGSEKKSSNAEVDYVIQQQENIIPIEVKAGTKGAMQSMHLFLKEKPSKKGIRISLENFGKIESIDIYPLYAVANLLRLG